MLQSSAYGGKCEAGDVVGVFYDADAHTISFYKVCFVDHLPAVSEMTFERLFAERSLSWSSIQWTAP